jgi:hypothetical protein
MPSGAAPRIRGRRDRYSTSSATAITPRDGRLLRQRCVSLISVWRFRDDDRSIERDWLGAVLRRARADVRAPRQRGHELAHPKRCGDREEEIARQHDSCVIPHKGAPRLRPGPRALRGDPFLAPCPIGYRMFAVERELLRLLKEVPDLETRIGELPTWL